MSKELAYLLDRFPQRTETFIVRELEGLRRLGVKPKLWTLHPPPEDCTELEGAGPFLERLDVLPPSICAAARSPLRCAELAFELVKGCSRSPRSMLPELWRTAAAFSLLKKLAGRPCHIHAHFGFVASTVAYAAWRLAKVPYSVSVHAWDVFANRSMLPEKLRAARLVLTCTEHARRRLLRRYKQLDKERLLCVYHGVDTGLYNPSPFPEAGKFSILAVGRLEPKKGFDVLLRAFARARCALKDMRPALTIVGEGRERKRLEALASELNLGGSLRMAGALTPKQVREELARAHVLVAPSVRTSKGDSDGLPNAVLEAMACGRPVVGSRLAGIPEAVDDGANGLLFPPGDDEALAACLVALGRNRTLLTKLGDFARRTAIERFSLERSAQGLSEAFRRIGVLS